MLVEVAVFVTPTQQEAETGAQEKLILPFTAVTARDQNVALLAIGAQARTNKDLAAAIDTRPGNIQIRIRQS